MVNDSSPERGDAAPRPRWGRGRRLGVAAVTAGVVAVAAVGVAAAAGDTSSASAGASAPAVSGGGPDGFAGHRREGLGGRAVRGEFVVPKSGGGYQTVVLHRGTVTAVSSTSIRVRSADGVSRTFTVTADTMVNAARDGIETVQVNDAVAVAAVRSGDSATAVRIVDATRLDRSRQRFGFRERGPAAGSNSPR